MTQIILNRIRTPDGTVLTSYHRHDYKTYQDANGEVYMVDGGTEYLRRSVNTEKAKDLTVYYDPNDHKKNREAFHWGNRGKSGRDPLTFKPLVHMDTDHIEAILETQPQIIGKLPEKIFLDELEYRKGIRYKVANWLIDTFDLRGSIYYD